ncbi:MAG: helix-turn-helix domain-containing protein [Nitrospinae bacterium]|nr:helix-turn-helix domain-containing protein [Nitrospinota bacterium]
MTAKELAVYLAIKVKTVYSWVESGKIPAYKLNGALRFNLNEINEFICKNRVQPVNADRKAKKIIGEKVRFGHNQYDSGQKTPR